MDIINENNDVIGSVDLPEAAFASEDRLLLGLTYIGNGQLAVRESFLNKATGGSVLGLETIRSSAAEEPADVENAAPAEADKPVVPQSETAYGVAGAEAPPAGVEDPNNATDNAQDPNFKGVRRTAK